VHPEKFSACVFLSLTKTKNRGLPRHRGDRRRQQSREPLPGAITVVRADQIYLPRHALPPSLIACLIRLAAFQNPEFYAAQAMRRSTHDKPRIISCAELTSRHVALPRGCFDAVLDLLASLGITVTIEDCRFAGAAIPLAFTGALRSDQETAITALLPHDTGVLAATTAR
jgi:hypothetical protein